MPAVASWCPQRQRWRPVRPPRWLSRPMSVNNCWMCSTANASPTARRILSMPPCWTRGATSARCAPCIAPWRRTASRRSAGANGCTRSTPNRNFWPPRPTRSGAGISRNSKARPNGPVSTVILDIFSRYVVGWMVAPRETAELAEQLIAETVAKHNIPPNTLTLHADRGSSMRSKPVAALLVDLDVTKTHSRPYVSDDNPYSEAQFKTLKYRPDFPDRFGCIEDARSHCQRFFTWYNQSHCHSGIGYMTPTTVHFGQAATVYQARAKILETAFLTNPKRFKGKCPLPPSLPNAVWINPPTNA